MGFAERLRLARERKGMTQQEVADIMQIDKSTYCGYETGKRQPDVPKIKALSQILGVSGDELLETGFDTLSAIRDNDFTFAMHNAQRDLTDKDKRMLIEMAERLRKVKKE